MVYWGDTGFGDTPGTQSQGQGYGGQNGQGGGIDMNALSHLMKIIGIGGGAGEALGGAFNMFNSGRNDPGKAAAPYLNQIPGVAKGYLQPYSDAGQAAIPELNTQYQSLLNDTGGKYNQLASGYKESPGYQFKLQEGLRAANNMAAGKGYANSPMHERYRMETAQGLAGQDFENYLNHAMNLYGQGLQGQQGMMNQGHAASGDLANILSTNLSHQAHLAAESQAVKNKGRSSGFGGLINGATQILPWLFA